MHREDRFARPSGEAARGDVDDASARLAFELALKPPTKHVASIKAASDVYEAKLEEERQKAAPHRRSRSR